MLEDPTKKDQTIIQYTFDQVAKLSPKSASKPDTLIDSLIEKYTQRAPGDIEFISGALLKMGSVVLVQFNSIETE